MDLSPKSFPISDVEKNKELVEVGTRLRFIGEGWVDSFTVSYVFNDDFSAVDSDGEEFFYKFSQLQIGWEFK